MKQMNINMYGTLLSINSNSLIIKFDDLLNTLNDKLNASRH
jgi:hypothetical protein